MKEYNIPNFMVYAFSSDEGAYQSLLVDMANLQYEYLCGMDIRDITSEQRCKSHKCEVSEQAFDMIFSICKERMGGSFYEVEDSYEQRKLAQKRLKEVEKAKPCIPADKVWQAIRCELPENEMNSLFNFDNRYEKAEYYDFDCIMDKLRRYEQGEISDSYFRTWCLILMRCFGDYMSNAKGKRFNIYYNLSDMLDGMAFWIGSDTRTKVISELTAWFKWNNHLLQNIANRTNRPFAKNGVIVYTTFGFSTNGGKDEIDYLCIADTVNERFNYKAVKNHILNKDIDYTFVNKVEFSDFPSEYYEYEFDETLDETAQLKPSVDVD